MNAVLLEVAEELINNIRKANQLLSSADNMGDSLTHGIRQPSMMRGHQYKRTQFFCWIDG